MGAFPIGGNEMLDIFCDAGESTEMWWNDEARFWMCEPLHWRLLDNMKEFRLSGI